MMELALADYQVLTHITYTVRDLTTKEYAQASGESLWTKDKAKAMSFDFKEYADLYKDTIQKYVPDHKLSIQVIEQKV
jgi:hypothetical protein